MYALDTVNLSFRLALKAADFMMHTFSSEETKLQKIRNVHVRGTVKDSRTGKRGRTKNGANDASNEMTLSQDKYHNMLNTICKYLHLSK